MPILNKSQAKRKVVASTSLHYENETSKANDESGQAVENNMSVDLLIDPEDYDAAGSTHFPNEESAHPVLAGKRVAKAVKAAELEDPDAGGSTVDPTTKNVGTIPNDVDPDAGYIGASEEDEEDDTDEPEGDDPDADFGVDEEEDEPEVEEASVSGDELQNNMSVNPLEAAEDGGEDDPDWDAAPDAEDEDDLDSDDDDDDAGDEVAEELPVEPEDLPAGEEDLSILDIDETPDDATDDVMFATAGTRLMAIKGARIIATMTGRMAVNSGRNDVYLTDQFQEVTAMQISEKGLRRGLKSMGFRLQTISLAKQSVLKAQVQKEVHKTTAAMRKVQAGNTQAFEQSLAIASVGINRNMFKGQPNALRAHLEGEFRRIGIHGARRILAHAFAEYGPAYAKQVVELAHKISAMPEQVRDGYVDALDLNSEVMDEPEEDVIPIGAVDEDFEDDIDDSFGESIHASLARPGTVVKASVAASGKYSVNANAMLNGTKSLF